jgi:hypothetical protein
MEDHVAERGISIMTVRVPPAGTQIDLDISIARGAFSELHYGSAEIGPAFQIAKTWMKNPHRLTFVCLKLIAEQSLMMPDALQQTFLGRFGILVQNQDEAGLDAPACVETVLDGQHLANGFEPSQVQSQAINAGSAPTA